MLFIVVMAFVVSWLPLHTFTLLHDFVPSLYDRMTEEEDNELIYYTSFYVCHWLAMSNSFANPIIYGFMNESFRVRSTIYAFLSQRRKPHLVARVVKV